MPGFITSRLAGPIASAIAALLLAALIWVGIDSLGKNAVIGELRGDKARLTRERDEARSDLSQCRTNRITIEESIRRQNAAVAAAQAEGERRNAELQRAATDARQRATDAQARARAILSRPGTGDACADAIAQIREVADARP